VRRKFEFFNEKFSLLTIRLHEKGWPFPFLFVVVAAAEGVGKKLLLSFIYSNAIQIMESFHGPKLSPPVSRSCSRPNRRQPEISIFFGILILQL